MLYLTSQPFCELTQRVDCFLGYSAVFMKKEWVFQKESTLYGKSFFLIFFFWVAICHSFYVYFLSYNTLQNMVGSHHTKYDEA